MTSVVEPDVFPQPALHPKSQRLNRFPARIARGAKGHGALLEAPSRAFITCTKAALRASEVLKPAILQTTLDRIARSNHEGVALDFNPDAEKTFGYPRSEASGVERADLSLPADVLSQG